MKDEFSFIQIIRATISMMIANGIIAAFSKRIFPTTVWDVREIYCTVGWIIIRMRARTANNLACIY